MLRIDYGIGGKVLYNREGYVVFDGEVEGATLLELSTEVGVWTGSVATGARLVLEEGSTLPGIPGSTRFQSARSYSLASDGSVAAVLSTIGAQTIQVLSSIVNGDLAVLTDTGVPVEQGNAEVRTATIGNIVRVPGLTAASLSTESRTSGVPENTIVLYPDDPALEPIDLVADIDLTVGDSGACRIDLANTRLGDSRLFAGDAGSIVFRPALAGEDCPHLYGVVRLADNQLELLLGEGETLPSRPDLRYQSFSIDEVLADGTIVLLADIYQEPKGARRTLATIEPGGDKRLLRVFDEVLSTPAANYASTFGGESDVHENGHIAVLVGLPQGTPREQVIFTDIARSFTADRDFSVREASTLSYRVSTLDPVPEPYGGDHFFSGLSFVHAMGDGGVAFVAEIDHPDIGGPIASGIWISDPGSEIGVREAYRFGESLPLVGGDNLVVERLTDFGVNGPATMTSTPDGALLFVTNTGPSTYSLVRLVPSTELKTRTAR